MNKGLYIGVVIQDSQKVFDTIDRRILLYKSKSVGGDNNDVSWFKSYYVIGDNLSTLMM